MQEVWPGRPSPLGATWDGSGVNFALYSENAEAVELCFFDKPDAASANRTIPLTQRTRHTWHAYVPGCAPRQLYGYRVHGRYDPWCGLRFNAAKVLVDPYAKALTGAVDWGRGSPFGYPLGHAEGDLARDDFDSAAAVPKSIVVDPRFDWGDDRPPRVPLQRSVIYEVHVKGFTARFPRLAAKLRGTYAGLAAPPVVDYLKQLGITAVELLPVHACQPEKPILDRGLTNYWGYNTLGYFAPDARYSGSGNLGEQVVEFKRMVKALHHAGLEVILDVVYNHTCEGNHLGPTLSWRGIDNPTYYCLEPGELRYYRDYTGCGNSLNMQHPAVLRMIADSLRYWVLEMHVDGFRFDLASALAREEGGPSRLASFFDIVHQDPVLNGVKLIAEPWDVSLGGYQVGGFPVDWSEWNGRYRDTVRRYWKGDHGLIADMAYRLTGSSDLYRDDGRSPAASINFLTCHDGFTLHDLVSYNHKHNEANLEDNRDGTNSNDSWNCGAEGDTNDAGIFALRLRQMRNLLATLFLSQGTPMLWAGDEFARTQGGNNNAYCQDNEIGWVDWKRVRENSELLDFTRELIKFRAKHPVFRRSRFFEGRDFSLDQIKDITWLRPDGKEMRGEDWGTGWAQCVGVQLDGRDLPELDEHGKPRTDSVFLLLLNAYHEPIGFTLPAALSAGKWHLRFDTSHGWAGTSGPSVVALDPSSKYSLSDRAMAVFEWVAR
jgi:glycogen operon protein